MRIAYVNTYFDSRATTGGNAHVGQFVANAVDLGHEVWAGTENQHPAVKHLPQGRLARLRVLRSMDVIYTRLEWFPPGPTRWALSPYRQLLKSPLMVWEFNTVPEFGLVLGKTEEAVQKAIVAFRHFGQGCDLAVCVSKVLAEYVREHLNIKHTITVLNGSDPSLFRPDVPPVRRVLHDGQRLNVVWIGSADLSWHNFDLLREAAELLLRQGIVENRIAFHIIGQNIRSMRDMPPNIHYHGSEKYEALPPWLTAMDVGLALYKPGPSDYGSPLKLFDYMSSGLAVVATIHPQIGEIFAELDQTDLLVAPDDPSQLARVLLRLSENRNRVRQLGKEGRQLVVRKYNWRQAIQKTMVGIEEMLQEKGRK